ncbi:hypothetical protein FOA52_011106 [Chlamydomonas sp. UWO 241]|nr:hypothetical protein FOA52_004322 [Chlamydomonas sp. UWO 241]KAG1679506.1 hypothetical protein FOA52_011106 [Chlamydomonas sp. UWO 241]
MAPRPTAARILPVAFVCFLTVFHGAGAQEVEVVNAAPPADPQTSPQYLDFWSALISPSSPPSTSTAAGAPPADPNFDFWSALISPSSPPSASAAAGDAAAADQKFFDFWTAQLAPPAGTPAVSDADALAFWTGLVDGTGKQAAEAPAVAGASEGEEATPDATTTGDSEEPLVTGQERTDDSSDGGVEGSAAVQPDTAPAGAASAVDEGGDGSKNVPLILGLSISLGVLAVAAVVYGVWRWLARSQSERRERFTPLVGGAADAV